MYNFDLEINRNNTNCVKWDSKPGKLPMWVADMDFPVFDSIVQFSKVTFLLFQPKYSPIINESLT